jgi:endonuclease YncB( thermonuclease family)
MPYAAAAALAFASIIIIAKRPWERPVQPPPKQAPDPGPVAEAVPDTAMFAAAPLAPPGKMITARSFKPPYLPVSAVEIGANGWNIVLTGLNAPRVNTVCMRRSGERWPCGIMARAALYNLIRQNDMHCIGATDMVNRRIEGSCYVRGEDVSLALLAGGWAFTTEFGLHQRNAAWKSARDARRGLWSESDDAP